MGARTSASEVALMLLILGGCVATALHALGAHQSLMALHGTAAKAGFRLYMSELTSTIQV